MADLLRSPNQDQRSIVVGRRARDGVRPKWVPQRAVYQPAPSEEIQNLYEVVLPDLGREMSGSAQMGGAPTAVYEDRLLAFLDILGFTQLVATSTRDEGVARQILHLFTSLNRMMSELQSDDLAVTIISDTICISSRARPNFSSFCGGLSLFVTGLLGMGYPIRGALARGMLYHRGNTIFGPCLLRAYDLERRLAVFPRIIIDPALSIDLDPEGQQFELTYRDADGLMCLNFLSPVLLLVMITLLGEPTDKVLDDILAHIGRMLSGATDDAARQKLQWLATYAGRSIGGTQPSSGLIEELVRKFRAMMPPNTGE